MRKIFSLLVILGIIFIFGCSKEEPTTTISAAVIEEIESEEEAPDIGEDYVMILTKWCNG